jgi:hypothetical protein
MRSARSRSKTFTPVADSGSAPDRSSATAPRAGLFAENVRHKREHHVMIEQGAGGRFATAASSTVRAVKSLTDHCWSRLCDCTFPKARGGHMSMRADHTPAQALQLKQ